MRKFSAEVTGSKGNKYEVSFGLTSMGQLYCKCTCPAKRLCRHMALAVIENSGFEKTLGWSKVHEEHVQKLACLLITKHEFETKRTDIDAEIEKLKKTISSMVSFK